MIELIGGAVITAGGGLMSASSISLALASRRWRSGREFGAGLAGALEPTAAAPIPAEMAALLDKIS